MRSLLDNLDDYGAVIAMKMEALLSVCFVLGTVMLAPKRTAVIANGNRQCDQGKGPRMAIRILVIRKNVITVLCLSFPSSPGDHPVPTPLHSKPGTSGAGEMAGQLRALAAPPEDLSSII